MVCFCFSVITLILQNVLLAFNPTVQTINPSDAMFSVKYSIRDATEISDSMVKNNYSIELSPLKTQSSIVSSLIIQATYFMPRTLIHIYTIYVVSRR